MTRLTSWRAAALLLLAGLCQAALAGPVLADWGFADPLATTLNHTANAGTGLNGTPGAWSVAVTGVATNGAGQLAIGNDGKGGSGTRSAYADFGPDFATVGSGKLSLFTRFSAWNLAAAGQVQNFALDFIEGNDFATAGFRFSATDAGFMLRGAADGGDAASVAVGAAFGRFAPLTVRLELDLDALSYTLAYDLGAGFVALGGAALDPFTAGVNSLRLGLEGDYRTNGLLLDRIWLAPGGSVPEPVSAILVLTGLALAALARPPRPHQQHHMPS